MVGLLKIFDLGIAVLVPAIVWTTLIAGVFQLIGESLPKPKVTPGWAARQARTR